MVSKNVFSLTQPIGLKISIPIFSKIGFEIGPNLAPFNVSCENKYLNFFRKKI